MEYVSCSILLQMLASRRKCEEVLSKIITERTRRKKEGSTRQTDYIMQHIELLPVDI